MSERNIILNIQHATIQFGEPSQCHSGMTVSFAGGVKSEDFQFDLNGPAELEWSPTLADGKKVNYAGAEAAIKALNASQDAGREPWRLPTRRELESILDLTRHDPCIDLEKYPDTKSEWYWSSTPCAWSPGFIWLVSFSNGSVDYAIHSYGGSGLVRAVRAAASNAGGGHE